MYIYVFIEAVWASGQVVLEMSGQIAYVCVCGAFLLGFDGWRSLCII